MHKDWHYKIKGINVNIFLHLSYRNFNIGYMIDEYDTWIGLGFITINLYSSKKHNEYLRRLEQKEEEFFGC